MQSILLPNGIGAILLSVLFIIGACYFVYALFKMPTPFILKLQILFILMNGFYFMIGDKFIAKSNTLFVSEVHTLGYIKNVLFLQIVLFWIYVVSYKNYLSKIDLLYLLLILLFEGIVIFTDQQKNFEEDLAGFGVNNYGYIFVSLLPFLWLIKRKIVFYGILIIMIFFIINSGKRGAILCLMLFLIYFIIIQLKFANFRKNKFSVIVFLIFVYFIIQYVTNTIDTNPLLQQRIEETSNNNSSGRDIVYYTLFNYWTDSDNPINLLFGYGVGKTVSLNGIWAHNDWLELLIQSGLFGVILYLLFFIALIKLTKTKYLSQTEKEILISILLIFSIKSIFSMGYCDMTMLPIYIMLGYIIGQYQRRRECESIIKIC